MAGGWVAVHMPGHIPGHTARRHPDRQLLTARGALGFALWGPLRLPKRVHAEDRGAAQASVHKLAALQPATICFGHGPELHNTAHMLAQLAQASDRRLAKS